MLKVVSSHAKCGFETSARSIRAGGTIFQTSKIGPETGTLLVPARGEMHQTGIAPNLAK